MTLRPLQQALAQFVRVNICRKKVMISPADFFCSMPVMAFNDLSIYDNILSRGGKDHAIGSLDDVP